MGWAPCDVGSSSLVAPACGWGKKTVGNDGTNIHVINSDGGLDAAVPWAAGGRCYSSCYEPAIPAWTAW